MNKDLCRSVVRWGTLAAVLVVFVTAAACGDDTQTTTTAPASPSGELVRGGELTLARLEEPLTLDPVGPSDNGSIYLIEQVTESLVEPDETGAGLVPGLAEKWDISKDGLEYTFYLRDAKFSNGDPVTTDDVLFSLGRASDTKAGPYAFLFQGVEKMEAPDASTVKITLKEPIASFLSSVAIFAAGIVPKAFFEADPEGYGNNPVGSGPFMVESYTRGDNVVLVPNPYYWKLGTDGKPLPYLEKVTVKYVPESNARVLGLRNGDFDVIDNVPFNEGKSLDSEADITLGVDEIYKLDYLYINHQNPPLSNRDFVLAMNYATDRQAILDTVFFGYGQLPNSFMPKMNFWDEKVAAIPYDPAKAKEYLGKSGYDGKPIEILVPAGDAPRKQIAQILQQTWGEAGINAKIVELDIGAAWEKVTAGDYQVEVNYITSDINDDDELATMMGDYWAPGDARGFFSWYQNKDAAAILAKARRTSDPAERAGYYSQVQAIIYGDGYSVPFNFTPALTGYWNYVQNWRTLTVGWWWLDQVWMNK